MSIKERCARRCDRWFPSRSYSAHIQAGITNDDLSSFGTSFRLRTGYRIHFRPEYLTYIQRNVWSTRNKCKFLWQPSPRVLIVSRMDRALFKRPHFSAFYRISILSIIRISVKHKKKREKKWAPSLVRRLPVRVTRISSEISGSPQRSPQQTPRSTLPLEVDVSICHINKVNPSPNRKPFSPVRLVRRKSRSLANGKEGLPRLSRKNSLELRIRGRKGGGERKDRIDETSNWVPP